MRGYTKNIAVIKGLKDGFSVDGGNLTGLVKAEKYGSGFKAEVTYINFAPLSEGRYVTGISDGTHTVIVENGFFEGLSPIETGNGFAALVCYVNKNEVNPVASAVSGNFGGAALGIRDEIEKSEKITRDGDGEIAASGKNSTDGVYEDEAIAEVNYYELAETDEDGGTLRQNKDEEKTGRKAEQNEENPRPRETRRGDSADAGATVTENARRPKLAGGNFYARMKNEIEGLLSAYPPEENLQKTVKGSRWVKISYGDGKFYVFGVINEGMKPRYICYGVPSVNTDRPPESMQGLASFIPSSADGGKEGFWVMYQDADTGASLKIDFE